MGFHMVNSLLHADSMAAERCDDFRYTLVRFHNCVEVWLLAGPSNRIALTGVDACFDLGNVLLRREATFAVGIVIRHALEADAIHAFYFGDCGFHR